MNHPWKDLGDGRPVRVKPCPMCGVAPAAVDDCGCFGDPACPYFGRDGLPPDPTPGENRYCKLRDHNIDDREWDDLSDDEKEMWEMLAAEMRQHPAGQAETIIDTSQT